jgi:hypothetical protein
MSQVEVDLVREQARVEEKEKLALITPLIHGLQLRNSEVDALLTLPKKNLKALNKKVEDRLSMKNHTTVIHDPTKPANLLWAVAKAACPPNEKVVVGRRYMANLSGVQVMACFASAKQLYALAQEKKDVVDKKVDTDEK